MRRGPGPHRIASRRLVARRVRRALQAAATLTAALSGGTASASEVRTVTRTIGEGYMVRLAGPDGQLVGRRRIAQYVTLGVFDLLPPKRPGELVRDPRDGQLQLVASLRLRHDFGTFLRSAPRSSSSLLESEDGRQIDLLYGYFEARRLAGMVDFRLGRQFEMSGLDFYAFDGALVRVHTPAHLAVEAFGGLQVNGTTMFGFPTFELDGTHDTPADRALSTTVGTAIALDEVRFADMRFAYRRTWSPTSLARAEDPLDAGTVVDQELVSAQLALRLARDRVAPFVAGRYNLGTSTLDDLSGGLYWSMTPMHSLRAMYLRTVPTFDLDSIWNVFAVEPFEDVRVVYEIAPSPRLRLYSRFQGRFFHAATTAEQGTAPRDRVVFGGGGGVGATLRLRRFALRTDGYALGGEGGLRVGGQLDTRTNVLYDRIAVDGRVYAVYYRDEIDQAREGYSVALQVGTHVKLVQGISFNVMAEELFTPYLRHGFRAFGMLTMDWAFRVGRR